jgi:hypothetical protein
MPRRALAGGALAVVALALTPMLAGAASGTWALATSPNPGTNSNSLSGVACPSANDCWAVGYRSDSGPDQTLIEHWNGSTWSVTPSGNENNGTTLYGNQLSGVSCVSASDCWAVGTFVGTGIGTFYEPLWEHWDGTSWTASTFVVGIATNYWLNSVSCVDSSHCWAVGFKISGPTTSVWIQQWNGSSWITDPSTDDGILHGVSCVNATHCWAVGQTSASPVQTRIETWNGTVWTAATSPDANAQANTLNGVSCVDVTHCWAAGQYYDGTKYQNLLVGWNGTAWTVTTSAASNNNSPSENTNLLKGVTCLSTSYCWAVGDSEVGTQPARTLIDRWDGTSWTLATGTPNATDTTLNDVLRGVACGDASNCAAVGDAFPPDPTLILQFTVPATTTPTPIPVPNTGAAGSPSPMAGGLVLGMGLAVLLGCGALLVGRRRPHQG